MSGERLSITEDQVARKALCDALNTVRGAARFARLGDIYQAACSIFGFQGSLHGALSLLNSTPGIYVEYADCLEAARVLDGRIK